MKLFRLVTFIFVSVGILALTAGEGAGTSAEATVMWDDQGPGADLTSDLAGGLPFRCVGPALTSGRISAITIDPRDSKVWYVCAAAGGLWKTVDGGTSFKCMTDNINSFCMGSVALDPKNPDIVWLGTGEQQSQRSVDFGDGVYKSMDGGKTWKNMGLVTSEHIARIRIDPRNTDVVYVASVGPLWNGGGDRGVYKTTDGGKTWKASLTISENTGVVDLVIDAQNPDNLYAAAFQRRRHTGCCISGGPESGIYRTHDGGATWTKITKGIPTSNMGRIALEISPQNTNTVYAQISAVSGSGFYRSDDKGVTWAQTSTGGGGANMYYGDIYADPHKAGKVVITNTNLSVTNDGGKTISALGVGKGVHVDHHAVAFDLKDPNHVLLGNDGGLYESKDGWKTFRHFPAIAVSQFYKMCVDNATPFYNVYGGTQDNGSQRVASRTINKIGIRTADSKKVGGGDGFQPRVDPLDPKIVYTTSQNGAMSRSDGAKGGKGGGGGKSIRPAGGGGGGGKGGGGGGAAWNWDTPYIISPHSNTRLYAGSNLVYRSDNRGDSWKAISPNLTRSMKAMEIPIMGKVWGKDTPARNASTTPISVLNALEESPLVEGLIYAGTNDGILAVTEDTGKNWRKIDTFPGIPKLATISHICPSNHDKDTVYVSFIYYEYGDFKPYILKSTDRANTWTSISSNLSARDFVWTIVEDPVKKGLLFAGTEFGLYFSVDDGKKWVQFKSGLPIISFRDMEIQKREGDLVCCTFGRGFFILDDLTALRQFTPQTATKEGTLFAPRKTYVYEEKTNVQRPADNSEMPNPQFGALISYYLGKDLASGQKIVLTVMDASGKKLREVEGTAKAGFNRAVWDLRPAGGETTLVKPGKYKVTLAKVGASNVTPLGEAQEFEVVPLPSSATGEEQAFIDQKLLTPAL